MFAESEGKTHFKLALMRLRGNDAEEARAEVTAFHLQASSTTRQPVLPDAPVTAMQVMGGLVPKLWAPFSWPTGLAGDSQPGAGWVG